MKRKLLALGLALLLVLTAGCGAAPATQVTSSPSPYGTQTPPERPSPSSTVSPSVPPTPSPTPFPSATPVSTAEPSTQPFVQDVELNDYILNTNTRKFHKHGCYSVDQMKESNKQAYTGLREDVIARGYSPCGRCRP